MSATTRAGAPLLGPWPPPLTRLGADEVAGLMDDGAAVVDVRLGRDYDREHIPGSYSIGIDGPVSAWVGWRIARARVIVLAGGTESQPPQAPRQPPRSVFRTSAPPLAGGEGLRRCDRPGGWSLHS